MLTGAVGAVRAPIAAAELEGGDEPGLVSVDTPDAPSKALEQLLNQVGHHALVLMLLCGIGTANLTFSQDVISRRFFIHLSLTQLTHIFLGRISFIGSSDVTSHYHLQ